jgi:hypothetical protein
MCQEASLERIVEVSLDKDNKSQVEKKEGVGPLHN